MKKEISNTQAKSIIEAFFKKDSFSKEDVKKIKRLSMKFNIKLGKLKSNYCKKCFSKLSGNTRITKYYKIITCNYCNNKNRVYLKNKD